jgi:hypothetical protein
MRSLIALLCVLVLAACTSGDGTRVVEASARDQARSTDGVANPATSDGGGNPAISDGGEEARPCPTSAPPPASGFYGHSALLSGACDSRETTCQLAVLDCDVPGSFGPINKYICSCTSGAWSCRVDIPGGGTCLPSDWTPGARDASATDAAGAATDAATDASAGDGGTTN